MKKFPGVFRVLALCTLHRIGILTRLWYPQSPQFCPEIFYVDDDPAPGAAPDVSGPPATNHPYTSNYQNSQNRRTKNSPGRAPFLSRMNEKVPECSSRHVMRKNFRSPKPADSCQTNKFSLIILI